MLCVVVVVRAIGEGGGRYFVRRPGGPNFAYKCRMGFHEAGNECVRGVVGPGAPKSLEKKWLRGWRLFRRQAGKSMFHCGIFACTLCGTKATNGRPTRTPFHAEAAGGGEALSYNTCDNITHPLERFSEHMFPVRNEKAHANQNGCFGNISSKTFS